MSSSYSIPLSYYVFKPKPLEYLKVSLLKSNCFQKPLLIRMNIYNNINYKIIQKSNRRVIFPHINDVNIL